MFDELVFHIEEAKESEYQEGKLLSVEIEKGSRSPHIYMNTKGMDELLEHLETQKKDVFKSEHGYPEKGSKWETIWGYLNGRKKIENNKEYAVLIILGGKFDKEPYINMEYAIWNKVSLKINSNASGLKIFQSILKGIKENEVLWGKKIKNTWINKEKVSMSIYEEKDKSKIDYKSNYKGNFTNYARSKLLETYSFHKVREKKEKVFCIEVDFEDKCVHFYVNDEGFKLLSEKVEGQIKDKYSEWMFMPYEEFELEWDNITRGKYGPDNQKKITSFSIYGGLAV